MLIHTNITGKQRRREEGLDDRKKNRKEKNEEEMVNIKKEKSKRGKLHELFTEVNRKYKEKEERKRQMESPYLNLCSFLCR